MTEEVGLRLSVKDRIRAQREMREMRQEVDEFGKSVDDVGSKSERVSRLGGVGRGITRSFQAALVPSKALLLTIGGIGATLGGLAAYGGIKRLIGIEDAEARMKSMGLSTKEVAAQSKGLLRVLKGTPFALDEGAGSMAKLISAGRPLDKIKGTMKLIADSAAFAEAPLGEVADIFGKIQTQGRLTATEIMQLETRGVPALRMLADAAGVSGEEMRSMISNREIDADRFFRLYEKGARGFGKENIRIAGSAKDMGDTTAGAFTNMLTAVSRLGATALDPFYQRARHVFTGITRWLDELAAKVGPLVERFADKIPAALEVVGNVLGDDLEGKLKMLGAAIGGMLVPAVLSLAAAAASMVIAIAPWAILGIIALKVYELYKSGEAFRTVLKVLLPVLVGVGVALATYFAVAKLKQLWAALKVGIALFRLLWATMMANPVFAIIAIVATLAILIIQNWDTIKEATGKAWTWIKEKTSSAWQAIKDIAGRIFRGVADTIGRVWNGVQTIFSNAFNWLIDQINKVIRVVNNIPGVEISQLQNVAGPGAFVGQEDRHKANQLASEGDRFAGRALGGRAYAGLGYLVGEERPEVFVPDRSGTILPRVDAGEALAGPRPLQIGKMEVNINAGQRDARELWRELKGVIEGEMADA